MHSNAHRRTGCQSNCFHLNTTTVMVIGQNRKSTDESFQKHWWANGKQKKRAKLSIIKIDFGDLHSEFQELRQGTRALRTAANHSDQPNCQAGSGWGPIGKWCEFEIADLISKQIVVLLSPMSSGRFVNSRHCRRLVDSLLNLAGEYSSLFRETFAVDSNLKTIQKCWWSLWMAKWLELIAPNWHIVGVFTLEGPK